MKKINCLAVLILFLLSGCSPKQQAIPSPTGTQITVPVGLSFPPISTASGLAFTIKQMDALNMTLVRIGSNWAHREPEPGAYYWDPLDERINALHESGASILFTIPASGPDWACGEVSANETCVFQDEAAFRAYVTALMTRYRGKIDKVQFGNEWDNLTWYPGTAEEFVRDTNIVYDIVQQVSPETPVVLGGLTAAYPVYVSVCRNGMSLNFDALDLKDDTDLNARIERTICARDELEARVEYVIENARYDVVDLHLYDTSEYWPLLVDTVRQLTDKPLIVSEFGGPSSAFEKYSQAYHARRLEHYLLTLQSLPIEEAYYFNLVDNPTTYHSRSGLFTVTRRKKDAFNVMQRMLAAEKE
jgi:hypothetical protein